MNEAPLAIIIEDHLQQADIYARAMQAAGMETEQIHDGQAALDRLASDPAPHVIVLDFHLPAVSGQVILRRLLIDERYHRSHIIIATADSAAADEFRGLLDHIFVKPVSYVQLRDLAQRLIN
jgi:DNA-binding response OmpR family regulator